MPRRDDLETILIVGSGPIVIGQACEFDYSGTQACKVLSAEGYRVVLVNSNPATIMTDPEFAAATYIEPLTADSVERVIDRERPDALLPTLGGQTALNLAVALRDSGVRDRYGVALIGAAARGPPTTATSCAKSPGMRAPPARRRRAASNSRCSAGRSTSSRSCATTPTTWSSFARSRTSTRWACTRATRSRWRPRRR